MKKLYFLLIIALLVGCKSTEKVAKNDPNGETFMIKTGETFEVHFLSNASLGTKWIWKNKESVAIVDSVGLRYEQKSPEGMVGAASDMFYKFEGVKSGTDTLEFWSCRVWEIDTPLKVVKKVVKVK